MYDGKFTLFSAVLPLSGIFNLPSPPYLQNSSVFAPLISLWPQGISLDTTERSKYLDVDGGR
jgi:hypothetical protein